MASAAIRMELGDNAVAELSDFMGHSEDVQRKHYRINPKERQIVNISQLLEAATGDYDEDVMDEIEFDSTNGVQISNSTSQNSASTQSDGSTQNAAAQQSLVPTVRKRKHVASRDDNEGEHILKNVLQLDLLNEKFSYT